MSSDNELEIYQFPSDEVDAVAEEMALANEINSDEEADTEHDDPGSLEDFVVPDDEPLDGEDDSFVAEDESESESLVDEAESEE